MSALPLPEVSPSDTPDGHAPNARIGTGRTPRREPIGRPVSETLRLCLVDPAADADEIVTVAVSTITTTYTAPGDRIMLADPEVAASGSSRTRQDRLVESILRLGRGAIAGPSRWTHGDHALATAGGDLPGAPGSGSGLGPNDVAKPVATPTDQQPLDDPPSPNTDGFELIIAGWSDRPADPLGIASWTPALACSGAIVVFTHRNELVRTRSGDEISWSQAAAQAGLITTARLALVHQPALPIQIAPQSGVLVFHRASAARRSGSRQRGAA